MPTKELAYVQAIIWQSMLKQFYYFHSVLSDQNRAIFIVRCQEPRQVPPCYIKDEVSAADSTMHAEPLQG